MIFILNTSEIVVGTLARKGTTNKVTPYFDDRHIEDLSTGAETFTFSTFANTREASNIVIGNLVAFKVEEGYKLFQITDVEEEHTQEFIKTAYCEMAGIELINEIVRAVNIPSANLKQFLNIILRDTEYQIGKVSGSLSDVHSIDLKTSKVYNLLQEYVIGKYGAEISFHVEIEGGRIVGKYIDCYAERGSFNGLRFEYGENITKVKKSVDSSELVTALIGEGKGVDFKTVEAPDKPKGQDWLGSPEAYERYNKKGSHIFDVFKFNTESPAELLAETRKELTRRSTPKFKYEVDVELLGQEVKVGDTVYIIDNTFVPVLHLSARVSKLEKSRTDKKKDKVVLANYKEIVSSITDADRDIASLIDERFPIKSNDISNGAVTGGKIPSNAVNGTHIIKDSITTEHLEANSITAEKIEAGQIKAEHILADAIKSKHITADQIEAKHIQADAITSDKIEANSILTKHLEADQIKADHISANQIVSSHILADQIKTDHLSANSITSEKIEANAITSDKIEANAITTNKILAGQVTADKIGANAITTDKLNANSVTANKIEANAITSDKIDANQVLAKHIKAGEITADKIGANQINANHIVAGSVNSDKIGANQILAKHIKAGEITADKVTTGELITNSAQIKMGIIGTAHIGTGQITNALISNGAINEAKILDASITSAKIKDANITSAKIGKAQIETAHINELSANVIKSGKLDTGLIEVSGVNGKLKIKANRLQVFDASATPVERVSIGDVDNDGSKYGLRVRGTDGTTILYDENGVYNEGITDGAITNPKIEENAVDSRTLNLDELFVSDSAFIDKLQATEIYTSKLVVDTIRNDLVNLEGAIKFTDLNKEINDVLFLKPEGSGETWINGGMIATDTIKADSIDLLSGITVSKDGKPTFSIDNTGSVQVSGVIKSFDYSNIVGQEKGYQLDPNGTAYLNEAILRGSVILPQAGITHSGSVNLIPYTNFKTNQVSKYKKWGIQTTLEYFEAEGGYIRVRNSTLDVADDPTGIVTPIATTTLKKGVPYVLTFKARSSSNTSNLDYIYIINNEEGVPNTKLSGVTINNHDSFEETQVVKFVPTRDYPTASFLIGFEDVAITGNSNLKGFSIKDIKLEEGTEVNPWYEESSVRFWAGASYENRNEAPFIVYQNGKVKATEGEFGGTFTGELNIGNILIKDTNTSQAEFLIRTNDNKSESVKLTDAQAIFNVDFKVGDAFSINLATKDIEFGDNTSLDLTSDKDGLTLSRKDGTTYNAFQVNTNSGGVHKIQSKNGYGGLSFISSGSNATAGVESPYDYKFTREDSKEAVNVNIQGNLVVTNKITMADDNKIELVSVGGANSGIDFMIR